LEIHAVLEASRGDWAVEVKTSGFDSLGRTGLLEFCRGNPKFRPLVITAPGDEPLARRHALVAMSWKQFSTSGPDARG
jgi:hypothetical protein